MSTTLHTDPNRVADMLEAVAQPRPASLGAVLSAAMLAAGVWWLQWPIAVVFGFFWLENALGGCFFFLRMLGLRGRLVGDNLRRSLDENAALSADERQRQLEAAGGCLHWVTPGFFLCHYGLFCLGHLVFVWVFFPGWADGFATAGGGLAIVTMLGWMIWDTRQFRARVDFRDTPRMVYMLTCYDRVLVLHLTLVLGGAVFMFAGGEWMAWLLIAIKLWFDLAGGVSLSRRLAESLRRRAQVPRVD